MIFHTQKAMEEHFKEKPDKLFGHVIMLRSQPVTREATRDADMRPEVKPSHSPPLIFDFLTLLFSLF